MFAQSLINVSSCPDLRVNTQEVRALCQPIEPTLATQHYLPRGSGVSDKPLKPGEAEHEKAPS